MALVDRSTCPAGHEQLYVRADRQGRCTRCGATLVRGVIDDALPKGRTVSTPGSAQPKLVVEEETEEP